MGVCNCSMFCYALRYVHSSIAIILMGKRELAALLYLSSWCLVMVKWLFVMVSWGCLRFVIVVFPDHTHYFSYDVAHIIHMYVLCMMVCIILNNTIHVVEPRWKKKKKDKGASILMHHV